MPSRVPFRVRALMVALVAAVVLAAPGAFARGAVWTSQCGAGFAQATGVALDGSGGAVVAGYVSGGALPGQHDFGGDYDAFVRRYHADGSIAWTHQFGTSGGDQAERVVTDAAGDVFVVGWTNGMLPGQTKVGPFDGFVRSYASDGTLRWTVPYGVPDPTTSTEGEGIA